MPDRERLEDLARQIEPAARCVLREIAQNVGELEGAAERAGDAIGGGHVGAEDAHREPPDGARHAVAIKVELRQARRADIGHGVHLHAVDDREEILAPQAVSARTIGEAREQRGSMAVAGRLRIAACCGAKERVA